MKLTKIFVLFILCFSISTAGFCCHIHAMAEESAVHSELSYITYTVKEGDTLWDIASEYNNISNCSYRDYVFDIIELNGLKNSMIYDGQLLLIPHDSLIASSK